MSHFSRNSQSQDPQTTHEFCDREGSKTRVDLGAQGLGAYTEDSKQKKAEIKNKKKKTQRSLWLFLSGDSPSCTLRDPLDHPTQPAASQAGTLGPRGTDAMGKLPSWGWYMKSSYSDSYSDSGPTYVFIQTSSIRNLIASVVAHTCNSQHRGGGGKWIESFRLA